jgi:hypothetical protein
MGPIRDPVVLKRGHEILQGERWWEYPIDEPPMIEAGGFRFYQFVWRKHGWEVTDGEQ